MDNLIQPPLPNRPSGVRRVYDWRVLNEIFFILRTGHRAKLAGTACPPVVESLQSPRQSPGIDGVFETLSSKVPVPLGSRPAGG